MQFMINLKNPNFPFLGWYIKKVSTIIIMLRSKRYLFSKDISVLCIVGGLRFSNRNSNEDRIWNVAVPDIPYLLLLCWFSIFPFKYFEIPCCFDNLLCEICFTPTSRLSPKQIFWNLLLYFIKNSKQNS